jgi:alpha-L-fucosidase
MPFTRVLESACMPQEEDIVAAEEGRDWEACMTFNGSWGYCDTAEDEWLTARDVVRMLRKCVAGGGNLLLNVGPKPDGTLPKLAHERLNKVGQWMDVYGEKCVYGRRPRAKGLLDVGNMLECTRDKDPKTAYAWCRNWPKQREVGIGWFKGKIKRVRLLMPQGTKAVNFTQDGSRVIISGLPKACPDKSVGIAVLQIDCEKKPGRWMSIHPEYGNLEWEWYNE